MDRSPIIDFEISFQNNFQIGNILDALNQCDFNLFNSISILTYLDIGNDFNMISEHFSSTSYNKFLDIINKKCTNKEHIIFFFSDKIYKNDFSLHYSFDRPDTISIWIENVGVPVFYWDKEERTEIIFRSYLSQLIQPLKMTVQIISVRCYLGEIEDAMMQLTSKEIIDLLSSTSDGQNEYNQFWPNFLSSK